MRVGEKETSEQAEIVRRYADLFSREQLDALHEAEGGASRRRARAALPAAQDLRGGPRLGELAEREDELENRLLAARVTFKGEEMPLRNAQAKLAVLPGYADREELGEHPGRGERALQPRPARADARRRGARGRALRHRRRGRAQRGGEGHLAARALARAARRRATTSTRATTASRALVRAPARRRARRTCRRASTPRTCAGSRRSSRPTRRSARPRCACRRSTSSAST